MYLITTHDATSATTRIRVPALRTEAAADASTQGRRIAGPVGRAYGAAVPASFKDAMSGVRAWSPPV